MIMFAVGGDDVEVIIIMLGVLGVIVATVVFAVIDFRRHMREGL